MIIVLIVLDNKMISLNNPYLIVITTLIILIIT